MMIFNIFLAILSSMLLIGTSIANPVSVATFSDSFAQGTQLGGIKFKGRIGNIDGLEIEGRDLNDVVAKARLQHPDLVSDPDVQPEYNDTLLESRAVNMPHCNVFGAKPALKNLLTKKGGQLDFLTGLFEHIVTIDPKKCWRLTCTNDAASIHWCNDEDYSLTFLLSKITSYAYTIVTDCVDHNKQGAQVTHGQLFDDLLRWNVIITAQSCAVPVDLGP